MDKNPSGEGRWDVYCVPFWRNTLQSCGTHKIWKHYNFTTGILKQPFVYQDTQFITFCRECIKNPNLHTLRTKFWMKSGLEVFHNLYQPVVWYLCIVITITIPYGLHRFCNKFNTNISNCSYHAWRRLLTLIICSSQRSNTHQTPKLTDSCSRTHCESNWTLLK